MSFDIEAAGKIIAPLITAGLSWLIKRYLEERPNLITYLLHTSTIHLDGQQPLDVNTHSIVVRNSGKKTANKIRIGHNVLPAFQIYPQIAHHIDQNKNGSAEIIIPTLVPGEQISISYLYFPPLTWNQINSHCKCDEMAAKYINVIPAMQLNRLQLTTIWGLMFIGASSIIYWVIYWLWVWLRNQ